MTFSSLAFRVHIVQRDWLSAGQVYFRGGAGPRQVLLVLRLQVEPVLVALPFRYGWDTLVSHIANLLFSRVLHLVVARSVLFSHESVGRERH